jgi:hypothetical protein
MSDLLSIGGIERAEFLCSHSMVNTDTIESRWAETSRLNHIREPWLVLIEALKGEARGCAHHRSSVLRI